MIVMFKLLGTWIGCLVWEARIERRIARVEPFLGFADTPKYRALNLLAKGQLRHLQVALAAFREQRSIVQVHLWPGMPVPDPKVEETRQAVNRAMTQAKLALERRTLEF
jgi:hypothetical protein